MNATDWKFDFESLHHWSIRKVNPWVYDEFYEIDNSDTLLCVYSIVEMRMMDYRGYVALLKNKESPRLILNAPEVLTFRPGFDQSDDGRYIFLKSIMYDRAKNKAYSLLLAVDLEKELYSYILSDNFNPCFNVVQTDEGVFSVKADEKQVETQEKLREFSKTVIYTDRLEWQAFSSLEKLDKVIFKRSRRLF